jgi:hypothetical protein
MAWYPSFRLEMGLRSSGIFVSLDIKALCTQALFVRFYERLAFLFTVHGNALVSGRLGSIKI